MMLLLLPLAVLPAATFHPWSRLTAVLPAWMTQGLYPQDLKDVVWIPVTMWLSVRYEFLWCLMLISVEERRRTAIDV